MRKLLEAALVLPMAEAEAVMDDIYRQIFFEDQTGDNLDKFLEAFGAIRKVARRATGDVNVTLNTALTTPPEVDPFFPSGSLTFLDTAGRKYELIEDISVNGTTSLVLPLRALELGGDGNIEIDSIVDVQFISSSISARWAANVASFTNDVAFIGGRDLQTDRLLRQEVRNARATRPHSGIDGLVEALRRHEADGVIAVSGFENETNIGQSQDKVFDSDTTGTASETIEAGGTYTKIAQKLTPSERRFIQHFGARVDYTVPTPEFRVRLETDNAGEPSGVLVASGFDKRGVGLDDDSFDTGTWDLGEYVETTSTIWLVWEVEVGSCTFDGDNAGGTNNVRRWDGAAWSASAVVKNLNMELIGGIPPSGFRLVIGGTATSTLIAQAIWDNKAAGARSDGLVSGTATDVSDRLQTMRWDEPDLTAVKATVVVTKTSEFDGDEDSIRDVIIEYIGGLDTGGNAHLGLNVNAKIVRNEIISRILEDANLKGLEDVTTLTIGRVSGSESASNLVPNDGEEFFVDDPADLSVTINEA